MSLSAKKTLHIYTNPIYRLRKNDRALQHVVYANSVLFLARKTVAVHVQTHKCLYRAKSIDN